jgi:multisubunit Na+/H+ antiporter MnhB subunit
VTLELILDLIVVLILILVAFRALRAPSLFGAVVLYIAFGLLLALVWVRLEAPDLALAEAAIGAGITGALLLDASGQLGPGAVPHARVRGFQRVAAAMASGGTVLVLAAAFLTLSDRSPSLSPLVSEQIPLSGVEHPVTAVLLNFRAYDTWLEVGVLLVAALALLGLRRTRTLSAGSPPADVEEVTAGAVSFLAPLTVLIGGYLLWRGTHAPGGAFQAGAIIGSVGVLLALLGRFPQVLFDGWLFRTLLLVGFVAFPLAGLVGLASGGKFLEFDPAVAGTLILIVEAAATASIALSLVLLFVGARPEGHAPKGAER